MDVLALVLPHAGPRGAAHVQVLGEGMRTVLVALGGAVVGVVALALAVSKPLVERWFGVPTRRNR